MLSKCVKKLKVSIEFAASISIEPRGNTSECECDKFKLSGISINFLSEERKYNFFQILIFFFSGWVVKDK